jgi:hypothetical protein
MKRIFLSYSRDRDHLLASRLKHFLEASSRFQVLDSSESHFENEQMPQIKSQIQRASVLIAMFRTKNSNVLFETGIALGAGKQILIMGGEPEALPVDLRSLPYVVTSGDIETDFTAVLRRLDSLNIEEEKPRPIYNSVAEKLQTYRNDPDYFESMSPLEFEELLTQWFENHGFRPNRTEKTHNFGVDFVAQSPIDQSTIVMEAKKFDRQSRVSMRDVMALLGAATLFGASTAVLVTSSSFTKAALEMAAESRNPKLRLLTMEEVLQSKNPAELVQ